MKVRILVQHDAGFVLIPVVGYMDLMDSLTEACAGAIRAGMELLRDKPLGYHTGFLWDLRGVQGSTAELSNFCKEIPERMFHKGISYKSRIAMVCNIVDQEALSDNRFEHAGDYYAQVFSTARLALPWLMDYLFL